MTRSGFAREARRRPEMDLLVGPIEAAEAHPADRRVDTIQPTVPPIESVEPAGLPEGSTGREDG